VEKQVEVKHENPRIMVSGFYPICRKRCYWYISTMRKLMVKRVGVAYHMQDRLERGTRRPEIDLLKKLGIRLQHSSLWTV
jgi:hypothetical protein